jgi:hypothetical protein
MFPDLVDSCPAALFKPSMSVVLDIITESVLELDNLTVLAIKVPNLEVLHIGEIR